MHGLKPMKWWQGMNKTYQRKWVSGFSVISRSLYGAQMKIGIYSLTVRDEKHIIVLVWEEIVVCNGGVTVSPALGPWPSELGLVQQFTQTALISPNPCSFNDCSCLIERNPHTAAPDAFIFFLNILIIPTLFHSFKLLLAVSLYVCSRQIQSEAGL